MSPRFAGKIALLVFLAVAVAPGIVRAQGASTGTQYVVFWRGDLRVIATRPNTRVTLIDMGTGAPLNAASYSSNFPTNPFDLDNPGDTLEAYNGSSTYRLRIVAETAKGPKEDKPVIVWTGALEAGLKHPAAPPTVTNSWMSNLPVLAPGSVENGTEIGREFWGFVSREMHIVVRKGAVPTSISILDVSSNVDPDTDDSQTLTAASPALQYQDGEVEIYYLDTFEDDTVHIQSNVDIMVTVGAGSRVGYDWTITPPSFGPGEDARELGTLFYTFVSRDLTIFPTQDNTTVRIRDLSDLDDSVTVSLVNGDLAGDYDIFITDTWAKNGTGMTARASGPAVQFVQLGASAPFENDYVRIEADRPILVYVGPKAADVNEYADVAYSVRTGPTSFLIYGYAQNGGAEDLQVFAFSGTTSVQITSLSYTTAFRNNGHHDFSIPFPTAWLGGNGAYGDYYWASTIWNGELLRITADGPITIIDGDYDGPNFGCFIPFVSDSGLLLPIADAGPDLDLCPGQTTITLDGTGSFDADTTAGAMTPSWSWDMDADVDGDADTDPTNDADATGPTVNWTFPPGKDYVVTLTYTDDDGQSDTDQLIVRSGDTKVPLLTCPPVAMKDADPVSGGAYVAVIATVSDNCDSTPTVTNDRTSGGADASEIYPCGATGVNFTATDDTGNTSRCTTLVAVVDVTGPAITCLPQVDAPTDSPTGATVPVFAAAVDNCDPGVVIANDRTAGGADATDFYPCGATTVTFSATDAAGNPSSCKTIVNVGPPEAPIGIGWALRARKDLADPYTVVHFTWDLAPAPRPWEHYNVYRTDTASVRPYPVLSTDPSLTAQAFTDADARGPLLFYEVFTADCLENEAVDP